MAWKCHGSTALSDKDVFWCYQGCLLRLAVILGGWFPYNNCLWLFYPNKKKKEEEEGRCLGCWAPAPAPNLFVLQILPPTVTRHILSLSCLSGETGIKVFDAAALITCSPELGDHLWWLQLHAVFRHHAFKQQHECCISHPLHVPSLPHTVRLCS